MKNSLLMGHAASRLSLRSRHHQRVGAFCLLTLTAFCFAFPALSCRAQTEPAAPPKAAPAPTITDAAITVTTRITAGCRLHISVTDEPGLTDDYEVDVNGAIHFTLADEENKHREQWSVTVAGKTAEEARGLVIESLKTYLKQPEVHLALVKMPRLHIEMAGSGCVSGPLEMPLDAHLSDVLFVCKQNADYAHVLIVRRQPRPVKSDGAVTTEAKNVPAPAPSEDTAPVPTRTLTVDLEAYEQGQGGEDLKLQDGDKIYIQMKPPGAPEHALRTARIVGEVGREVDVPLSAGMTVREALVRAGGLKDTADRNKIRLHRGESGRDYELKAVGIEGNDPETNMVLQPGDYIIVYKRDLSMRWGIDGEVMNRNIFPYIPGIPLTITRTVAIAGGLTKKADHRKGVLRKGYLLDPTRTRDIVFDYDAIMNKKQNDFEVEAGDVVMILPRQKRPTIWQQLLPLALKFIPLPF